MLKQLRIDNELTRGIGADIDLLRKLNIGSRKALGINALKRPSGSLSVIVVVVVVVSGRQRCELAGAGGAGDRIDHAALVQHP